MRNITVQKRLARCSDSINSIFSGEPVINSILHSRGIISKDELDLSLKGLLHPGQMAGLFEAAEVLKDAVLKREKILIVGDFDVDGATSTVLLMRVLKKFAVHDVDYLVPNRFDFGYGLSPKLVKFAAEKKTPDLIVTVDNGISSIEGVLLAKNLNIKVLITDHHLPGENIPEAEAILNPALHKRNKKFKNLAGVGVAFYLLAQTRIQLAKCGWFEEKKITPVKLSNYLDLVALGTIADLVPLDCNNRRLVSNGLKLIKAKGGNPGIQSLIELLGKSPRHINESDLAFSIAPRINAAGRLADISVGIECLLSDLPSACALHALSLDKINRERKTVEKKVKEEALEIALKISKKFSTGKIPPGFSLFGNEWHQGVSGIVASRIKETFNRPVIVFARDKADLLKGSARSVEGVHIRDVLSFIDANWPGTIIQFGGHAMAAGLSIYGNELENFGYRFNLALNHLYNKDYFNEIVFSDGELSADQYSVNFSKKLESLGPWGNGFPEPKFEGKFDILDIKRLNGGHIRMSLRPFGMKCNVEAVAFGVEGEPWVANASGLLAVFRLHINRFRNLEKVQLIMDKVIDFT